MCGEDDHGTAGPAIITEYNFFMELIFNIGAYRVNVNKPDHIINSVCSFSLQI